MHKKALTRYVTIMFILLISVIFVILYFTFNNGVIVQKVEKSTHTHISNACTRQLFWKSHFLESNHDRTTRIRRICNDNGFKDKVFTNFYRSSNAHNTCNTRHCPLLISKNYQSLLCFVQKVACTSMKKLFLFLNGNTTLNHRNLLENVKNLSTFHINADNVLLRASPMFMENTTYFKAIFVRHPLVRLVSAFKNKVESDGPDKEPHFHFKYWLPALERLHGKDNVNDSSRLTFREFVDEFLLNKDPYRYNEHWAPIWTRCEPCYMHYDFIGKLENADLDFEMFKHHINASFVNIKIWENSNKRFGSSAQIPYTEDDPKGKEEKILQQCNRLRSKYLETKGYLEQLPVETILKLYKIYYLDFELFGYTMEELMEID